jgi:2',3'-cyclic-nucleotide 2'-phosphodiesterase (5'-nucleotidase family)
VPIQIQYGQESIIATENVDSSLVNMYLPYKIKLDSAMHIILAHTTTEMTRQQPESALGNMVADIIYASATQSGISVDLAISNYGGIRIASLPKGEVMVEDAYKLMPFDNGVVVVKLEGKILRQLFNHMASKGGWPISHASYLIHDDIAENILINGFPLSDDKVYILATNDYIAGGGDYCDMLRPLKQVNTGILLRDAIIQYWKDMGQRGSFLNYNIEGRVMYVQ